MSKSKHFITCPHCNQKFNPSVSNKITKLSRKNDSAEFFDIEEAELINAKLKENNIEFGVIPKSKRKDE